MAQIAIEEMPVVNIGYEVFVSCHEKVIAETAKNPEKLAGVLFQNGFISDEIREEIQLPSHGNISKATELVAQIESKIKHYPGRYENILQMFRENGFVDLVVLLTRADDKIRIEDMTKRLGKLYSLLCH